MVMAVRTVARRRLVSITEVALYTDAKIEESERERDLLDGVDHEREREDRGEGVDHERERKIVKTDVTTVLSHL
jgi:hypothetical protein